MGRAEEGPLLRPPGVQQEDLRDFLEEPGHREVKRSLSPVASGL